MNINVIVAVASTAITVDAFESLFRFLFNTVVIFQLKLLLFRPLVNLINIFV